MFEVPYWDKMLHKLMKVYVSFVYHGIITLLLPVRYS